MKSKIYFEPPSRLQLLDKLKHLVRFSDFLLLVSGESGVGKSTLITQLKPEQTDSTLCCCVVEPKEGLTEQQLLDLLLEQLPSHEKGGTGFADHLKLFNFQLKALQAAGQKCLIVVDDAEKLSEPALELLLNLHTADATAGGAQLLFMAAPEFAERLLNHDSVRHMEGRVHHLTLEEMSPEETEEYLQVCYPATASLKPKKKAELITLSGGMPGRIETLLSGGKVSVSKKAGGATAFPLPPLHMAGIGFVLVGILGVSLWKFLPEEVENAALDVSTETVSVPLAVPMAQSNNENTEIKINSKPDISTDDYKHTGESDASVEAAVSSDMAAKAGAESKSLIEQAKQDLSAKLRAQEEKLKVKESLPKPDNKAVASSSSVLEKELREVVSGSPVITKKPALALKEAEPSVSAKRPENKVVKSVANSAAVSSSSDALLLKWKSSGYTLQMLGARSEESALKFIKNQKKPGDFHHFETVYKGAPWHVVVYGQYANRDIANSAIRKLSKELQKVKPWARSIKGVQIDIRKK
ncbi:AAA family ATPase [Neptuniibacter sp.]|uniref:AAA family ATPase n=1 Tax=Neptuniibacter sp. TaxID=1962643 RepID=UPI0026072AC1|nr:AAA family ATPase [Neptuniibacter sp.]MCP4596497.1 AAA family ATPase [Neptuniibacter sp.]